MTTRVAAVADRVRRALSLRGAVFGLLADCEPHDTEREAMQCASEDAWRILLACELSEGETTAPPQPD